MTTISWIDHRCSFAEELLLKVLLLPVVNVRSPDRIPGIPIIGSWTANDGAWYVQPAIEDDASVLASFQTYILKLSNSSLQRLLALYPLSDFTSLVVPEIKATA